MRLILLFFLFFSQIVFAETIILYTRTGCPHCEEAKVYLKNWQQSNSQHRVVIKNIWAQQSYMQELQNFAKQHEIKQLAVPLIRIDQKFYIGFPGETMMPQVLADLLNSETELSSFISLPLIGQIDANDYGIMTLTLILGLVDGFNPCAMWVLLILLSLLVHLKDRRKMFAISGVFVVTSGVVYFLFMSSWLLFYDFVSLGRPMQLLVGIVAMVIGMVHIKDYFAFGRGVSFSIPSSLKPVIMNKVRKVLKAKSTWAAMLSVVTLAIFVNFVELMCTAGLPAIYTKILQDNNITGSSRVLYLVAYNLFYMFDDAIMVGLAVWTLSSQRLQQASGERLKLISGMVLVLIAAIMIFYPEKLIF